MLFACVARRSSQSTDWNAELRRLLCYNNYREKSDKNAILKVFGVGHVYFQQLVGGGSLTFCAITREWVMFFKELGFHFLWPTPPPCTF